MNQETLEMKILDQMNQEIVHLKVREIQLPEKQNKGTLHQKTPQEEAEKQGLRENDRKCLLMYQSTEIFFWCFFI